MSVLWRLAGDPKIQRIGCVKCLSVVSLNYAMGETVTDKLRAIHVGSSVIINARYRGATPDEHNRLYMFTLQHEDWAEGRQLRYWDHDPSHLFRPDIPGVYELTVQTGYRPWYDPSVDHSWSPYSVTEGQEEVTVSFSVAAIVGDAMMQPEIAVPTLAPLDFLSLGVRYALPPIDTDTLSALYQAVSGEDTDDFCMRVHFKRVTQDGDQPEEWQTATCNEITPGSPTYMTVVGLQTETEYQLKHDYVRVPRPQPRDTDFEWTLTSGNVWIEPDSDCPAVPGIQNGEYVTYTTGPIPKAVQKRLSPYVMRPEYVENANLPTSSHEGYMMQCHLAVGYGKEGLATATDMNGNLVYYMPHYKGSFMFGEKSSGQFTRVSGRGTWFLWANGSKTLNPSLSSASLAQVWAEVDLEGIPLWTMGLYEVNDMLLASGSDLVAEVLGHHDAARTPDGYSTVDFSIPKEEHGLLDFFKCNKERKKPVSTERAEQVPEQHWDYVLEFDADRNLTKSWQAHEHVGISLAEQNVDSYNSVAFNLPTMSLEPIYYGDAALDRTHANTLLIDPSDGQVLMSARHYDAIFKLDWENGGDPVYNLQDFALFDADYQPYVKDYDADTTFFTHQHCIELYQVEGREDVRLVSIFDNDNTPVLKHGVTPPHSYGVLALINETRQEAVLLMRKQLPTFCAALGTSQVLANGNTWYHCGEHKSRRGWRDPFGYSSSVYEVSPSGEIVYSAGCDKASYRVFRMASLYGGTDYTPITNTASLPIPAEWDL
ncbi:arylsulfotransferase [Kipferlia bialata]|uniref:Arylsulfotransferase n=1 Tax=Kipferlia bialata TaxID=797122 RepID=A0A9K3GD91_9EUKA|nr:arylsulfotransferase [Kipferlia bialata]|eukprot:g183.t1